MLPQLKSPGWAFLLLSAVCAFASPARAETVGERARDHGGLGETHILLTYACRPQDRPTFRHYMETDGVAEFSGWKKRGVMKDYLILFSSMVNQQLPDMWVILDFEKFTDVANWQRVERDYPGGLSAAGLALARPATAVYADMGWSGGQRPKDPAKSVFMVIPYLEMADAGTYGNYVDAYVVPQLKEWVASGMMPTYRIFTDQNPTNCPWESLLVLEYDGMRGIALRDVVKQQVRDKLQADPGYRKYSAIKTTIRKELQPTTYYPILAAP